MRCNKYEGSIKQLCEQYGVPYKAYESYHRKHPEVTVPIYANIKRNKPKSLKKQCEELGISYINFFVFHKKHPKCTPEQYKIIVERKDKIKLEITKKKKECEKLGIKYTNFDSFYNTRLKKEGKKYTVKEYHKIITSPRKIKPITTYCLAKGIDADLCRRHMRKYPNSSPEDYQYISDFRLNNNISTNCHKLGINIVNYYNEKKKHPRLTPLQYYRRFGSDYNPQKGFAARCKELNIPIGAFRSYRRNQKLYHNNFNATPDDYDYYLKYIKPNKTAILCKENGVRPSSYYSYIRTNGFIEVKDFAIIARKEKKFKNALTKEAIK